MICEFYRAVNDKYAIFTFLSTGQYALLLLSFSGINLQILSGYKNIERTFACIYLSVQL